MCVINVNIIPAIYTHNNEIATLSLKNCIFSWFTFSSPIEEDENTVVANSVGIANPIIDKKIMDDCNPAFSLLNNCSFLWNPPAIILNPKINMIFPSIAPVIDAFTRSINPALIATIEIIISAALPKVTFKSEPRVEP